MQPGHIRPEQDARPDIDVALFAALSLGYDPIAQQEVLEGLTTGWRLSVEGEPPPRDWAPSFMTDEARERVTAHFEAETDIGRIIGQPTTEIKGFLVGPSTRPRDPG